MDLKQSESAFETKSTPSDIKLEDDESNDDEEEIELNPTESTYKYLNKLKKIAENKENPYYNLDVRRKDIHEYFYEQTKNTPISVLQSIEDSKENAVEVRLEQCEKRLRTLLQFGEEMVTNIRASNERREFDRRLIDNARSMSLKERVTGETQEAIAKLNNITASWFELDEIDEPIEMLDKINAQKDKIGQVMASKDKLIATLEDEINRANETYTAELVLQANDMEALAERVSIQIDLIQSAYNGQLSLLESTLQEERAKTLEDLLQKHHEIQKEMAESHDNKYAYVEEMRQFYDDHIQRLTNEQEEQTRAIVISLKRDCDKVERDLHEAKGNALLASEKLDYNFNILSKKIEENVIQTNQQKRRIARITLKNGILRSQIDESIATTKLEVSKIKGRLKKLHIIISDLESKTKFFVGVYRNKFDKSWELSFNEVKKIILDVFQIDKLLTEQQLAIPWNFPKVNLKNIYEEDVEPSNLTTSVVKTPKINLKPCVKPYKRRKILSPTEKQLTETETRLFRNLMRHFAGRTEFLLNDYLLTALKPYMEKDRKFVTIVNVFSTLNIIDFEMVKILIKFFMPYAYCPNCQKGATVEMLEKLFTEEANDPPSDMDDNRGNDVDPFDIRGSVSRRRSSTSRRSSRPSISLGRSAFFPKIAVNQNKVKAKVNNCKNHYLVVDASFILTALNDFCAYQQKKFKEYLIMKDVSYNKGKATQLEKSAIKINKTEIVEFFGKFMNYVKPEREKLWHAMEHGLNHFVVVLKKRVQLHKDCIELRQRNHELKFLLQKLVK